MEEQGLVPQLFKIQTAWELDLASLSRLAHVPEETLKTFLAMTHEKLNSLPTVPAELAPAVPLVSLFKRIQERYPDAKAQNDWLKNPNTVLEDQVPVDVMALSPEHLAYVSYVVESSLRLS